MALRLPGRQPKTRRSRRWDKMGLIRTLLALSVVLAHVDLGTGPRLVGGVLAVQMFYLISGFLISFVLVETSNYTSVRAFYVNRMLRLFPIYLVVACAALVFVTVTQRPEFTAVYATAPPAAIVALALSNAAIFGQDWIMFLGVHDHQLEFVKNFRESDVRLWEGLLVPQAWTLGVELSFYLVAPFLLKNRNLLLAAFIGSLAVRAALFMAGLGTTDPWQYRFFPSELSIFLLGAITCQIGLPAVRRLDPNIRANAVLLVTLAFVGLIAVFEYLPGRGALKEYIVLFLAAVCLPFAFLFQQRFRWDGWIGDLSYPLYICHLLVLWLVSFVFSSFGYSPQSIEASLVTILGSIFFAIVLNAAVARPVEALRRRIRRKDSKSLNETDAEPVGMVSGPGGGRQ